MLKIWKRFLLIQDHFAQNRFETTFGYPSAQFKMRDPTQFGDDTDTDQRASFGAYFLNSLTDNHVFFSPQSILYSGVNTGTAVALYFQNNENSNYHY